MQSVIYSQIPAYLSESAFYASLSADDDQAIVIPTDCLKPNDTVSNVIELHEYLHTARFWGIDIMPETVIKFVFQHEESASVVAQEFTSNFPMLHSAVTVVGETPSKRMRQAVASGYVLLVKCLREMGYPWDGMYRSKTSTISLSSTMAACLGHLDVLRFIREHDGAWDASTTLAAARGGHLSCLQYLHEGGCPWDENCCPVAANHGHLDCLWYCHTHGTPLAETAVAAYAVLNGQLECVKYAFKEGEVRAWKGLCMLAVQRGFSSILQYVHERSAGTVNSIASLAYISSLQLVDAHMQVTDHSMLACLQLALSLGYHQDLQFNWGLRKLLIERGLVRSVRWFHASVAPYVLEPSGFASLAAQHGQLECLKFLTELSDYRDEAVICSAVHHFHPEVVEYAIQKGYFLADRRVPFRGSIAGDRLLPWYEFAVQQNIYFGDLASHVLRSGQVDVLEYITTGKRREQFLANSSHSDLNYIARWHVDSVAYLHRNNVLTVRVPEINYFGEPSEHAGPTLHYLVEHVGVISGIIILWAAGHDDVILLQQLHEKGCVINDSTAYAALCSNSWSCMRYIVQHAADGVSDALVAKGVRLCALRRNK